MAAKYFVTTEPGIPVSTIGFMRAGWTFNAPEGFVPSPTLRALNAEAVAELDKVFAGAEAELEKRMRRVRGADSFALGRQIEKLRKQRELAKQILTDDQVAVLRRDMPQHSELRDGKPVGNV
jgi:hypothetical protein